MEWVGLAIDLAGVLAVRDAGTVAHDCGYRRTGDHDLLLARKASP